MRDVIIIIGITIINSNYSKTSRKNRSIFFFIFFFHHVSRQSYRLFIDKLGLLLFLFDRWPTNFNYIIRLNTNNTMTIIHVEYYFVYISLSGVGTDIQGVRNPFHVTVKFSNETPIFRLKKRPAWKTFCSYACTLVFWNIVFKHGAPNEKYHHENRFN